MTIFHKLVWSCGVFVKWLQHTLVKIPQWSCKITPSLPRQKHLCSQWPVSVHVSLIDNELLLTPPLSAVFFFVCIKWCVTIKNKTNPMHPQWLSCREKMKTLIFTFAFNYKTLGLLTRHSCRYSCSNTEKMADRVQLKYANICHGQGMSSMTSI